MDKVLEGFWSTVWIMSNRTVMCPTCIYQAMEQQGTNCDSGFVGTAFSTHPNQQPLRSPVYWCAKCGTIKDRHGQQVPTSYAVKDTDLEFSRRNAMLLVAASHVSDAWAEFDPVVMEAAIHQLRCAIRQIYTDT